MTGPLLTFGKYEGLSLGDAECADQQYLFWLVAQRRWVKRDHPEIYKAARKRVVQILQDEMTDERSWQERSQLPTAGRFKFMPVSDFLASDLT